MKTIHKFPLDVTDSQDVILRKGYKPLHVDWQNAKLML